MFITSSSAASAESQWNDRLTPGPWVTLGPGERRKTQSHNGGVGHEQLYSISIGLDVHAETITAAIAEGRGHIRSIGKLPNRPEAVRKLIEKLGGGRNLRVCYEAGPTGYALYWQLTKLGVDYEVIAPSLIPKKAGARFARRSRTWIAHAAQSP